MEEIEGDQEDLVEEEDLEEIEGDQEDLVEEEDLEIEVVEEEEEAGEELHLILIKELYFHLQEKVANCCEKYQSSEIFIVTLHYNFLSLKINIFLNS